LGIILYRIFYDEVAYKEIVPLDLQAEVCNFEKGQLLKALSH
jgi:hypothetical protein